MNDSSPASRENTIAKKISFCVTCKNRLWQLRQTLPLNLDAVKADGNSDIIVVNYNSADDLDAWMRQFRGVMESGILRYVHERTEPFFHCSKAKNLAHFAASGDFVVNLDGDNFIGDSLPQFRRVWAEREEAMVQGFCGDFQDGTYGRIGMARRHFLALGGYDEEMLPIGHHDRDLIARGKLYGLLLVRVKQTGVPALRNTIREKMAYTGLKMGHREMVKANTARLEDNLKSRRITVNAGRKPVPVLINYAIESTL